jgi:hypothetical protein
MNSTNFVIQKIDNLVAKIPNLQVRYEYDSFDNSHYVEVLPLASYKEDDTYIAFEQEFRQEFVKFYPRECLTFLSEGSLYEIESPIYIKEGTTSINYFVKNKSVSIKAKQFLRKTNNIFEKSSADFDKFQKVVLYEYHSTLENYPQSNFAFAA